MKADFSLHLPVGIMDSRWPRPQVVFRMTLVQLPHSFQWSQCFDSAGVLTQRAPTAKCRIIWQKYPLNLTQILPFSGKGTLFICSLCLAIVESQPTQTVSLSVFNTTDFLMQLFSSEWTWNSDIFWLVIAKCYSNSYPASLRCGSLLYDYKVVWNILELQLNYNSCIVCAAILTSILANRERSDRYFYWFFLNVSEQEVFFPKKPQCSGSENLCPSGDRVRSGKR